MLGNHEFESANKIKSSTSSRMAGSSRSMEMRTSYTASGSPASKALPVASPARLQAWGEDTIKRYVLRLPTDFVRDAIVSLAIPRGYLSGSIETCACGPPAR